MKIEIIKPRRFLVMGQKLDLTRAYAENLIKQGFAKSLEVVEAQQSEMVDPIKEIEKKPKAKK
jgi:hypothetical protein